MRIKSLKQLYDDVINDVQWARFGRTHMENYRGHALREYKLLPGLGRYEYDLADLAIREKCLYESFLKKVASHEIKTVRLPFKEGEKFEIKNYWYTLFQAQHLGLKTRLMDWSIRWETSLLFAVDEEKYNGEDGSFWIYFCPRKNLFNARNLQEMTLIHPLEFEGNAMINSPIYLFNDIIDIIGERRMGRQCGRFWVQSLEKSQHPLNEQPEFAPFLREIIIDGDSKSKIKKELADEGITMDFHYYRNDESIDETIKEINESILN